MKECERERERETERVKESQTGRHRDILLVCVCERLSA